MKQVDMSDKAVTARLKRVSQLRRLCLSLQKAKVRVEGNAKVTRSQGAKSFRAVKTKIK